MNDDFNTSADSGDAFTAEEQAAFDAYASGEPAPEAAGAAEPVAGGDAAPNAAAAAAAPAEAAAPGDVVDTDAEDGNADENKGKFVRHGAFHQERERRKAVERERDEARLQYARMEERLKVLTEGARPAAAAQAAPEPETPPDPNEDIFGYAKYLEKQIQDIRTGQTQMTEAQKAEREAQAQEAERGQVLNSYRGDVQRVMAAQPEFAQAYEHLFQGRIAELKVYGMSEADAVKAVRDDEFGLVQAAIAAGQSPAERILQLAKVRGFAPKPAEAAAAPAESPAEKAARISRGQAASKSLSVAGGAAAGELTLEMLANMSEAEFDRVSAQNPVRVRALMGG
ncbi:hypothetical protein [Methylobacterium sp. WCS2018Hpa-22]|uniref:hypothetical protein n=1 Tax=Methylobacterium sp. WCS2018Hpa-22 TaxID=3073633 RepID=UPI00288B14B7|nr:hypothetical protein [Methylobacterium sp. WCS2018Hpa-22]